MKKYIGIIILIGLTLGGILLYNIIEIEKKSNLEFADSGYILQNSGTSNNIERFYFNANEDYKTKYEQKVVFNNTEGEEIVTNKENFVHYADGSISSFTNGVILDLKEIEKDPIQYYNIAANNALEKNKEFYEIQNLDKVLKFSDIIWKIDTNKYIIISDNIKLTFNDSESKEIKGYVELEYLDNEIVKIYNQEVTYQTISSRAYIEFPDNIKITLSSKIVSKNNENKMSLENMVIDSDDNITIVDLTKEENKNDEKQEDEEKDENNKTETNNNGQTITNNNEQNNSNTQNNQNQTIIDGTNNNQNTNNNENNNGSANDDTDKDENNNDNTDKPIGGDDTQAPVEVIKTPKFKVEKFDINSIGFNAEITVEDDDNTLTEDYSISVLENRTGKTVYQYTESLGVYNIELAVSSLMPDTEYTLVVESTYSIDEITYTKNFIYKVFRTSTIGIEIEKDVFTDVSLGLGVIVNKDTKVKSIDVLVQDLAGNTLQTQTIDIDLDETADSKNLVKFTGLTSNTEYVVSITNVLYDGQILTNGYVQSTKYRTLKAKPEITGTSYEINKREGTFPLKLSNVVDKDKGIKKYTFQIYDTRVTDTLEPVKTIESTSPSATLKIDEDVIVRNVGYTFKVIAEFDDNEKIYEYESEYSNVMTMDGVGFPGVRFKEEEVTFERIKGIIIVEDPEKAINIATNQFVITYTDSTGNIQKFTSSGSYDIPLDVNNLRANETYRFAIYATIDLQDGNEPIDECYIGGFVIKTDVPKNMVAKFKNNKDDVKNVFNVSLQLEKEDEKQGELEPKTLSAITVSIYAGQTLEGEYPKGSPLRTIKLVDNNIKPYESDLKKQFYDNQQIITPEFFNANNDDFKDSYYTITVTNSYDYTKYQNQLPILNNVCTVKTNGYMPDLPSDVNNALTVTAIRNYTQETPKEELADSTVVGYVVKANYDNSGLYAKNIIYKAYDANTKALIQSKKIEIGADGVIPEVKFDVLEGTSQNIQDTDALRRGNSYYFTYEMLLDLNNDNVPETNYPYEENIELKSATQTPQKQEADLYMYPKISTKNSISFKYKFNDIDKTIGNGNRVTAKINNTTLAQKIITETGENFSEVTFDNLKEGTLLLTFSKCLVKKEGLQDTTFLTQYFEVENSISGLTYTIGYDTNKVSINFNDGANVLKYVTGIRIELISKTNNSIKIVKDYQTIPSNNIISINYNDLGILLKHTTEVNVYAYYDSGIVGFETEEQGKVTYQKAYKSASDKIYYYDINKESNLVEDTEPMGNMYSWKRDNNILDITNLSTGRKSKIELTYSERGFLYQGNPILQKQIKEGQVSCIGEKTIFFDLIIPGVSLKDDQGNWQISTELDNATIKADMLVYPETKLKDDLIYIDLYSTDKDYKTESFVRTLEIKLKEFENPIKITNLNPQEYYFIKFRTFVNNDDGTASEIYVYDLDFQNSGRSYYFSTLADVGVDKIEVKYEPVTYEEKYIDISYTLQRTTGYDRIEYNIYHYNSESKTYEEVMKGISADQIFNNTMNKKISINPGSEFIFGDQYKIKIIPIAEYVNLEGESITLELGAKEKEFTFEKLQKPTIAISGTRQENNEILFKATIYDDSKIIVGNEYTIKIYNSLLEDITPAEYKDKSFSINIINNIFRLPNVENTQSYTILITTQIDTENNNVKDEFEAYTRQYTIPAINEYGIAIGNLSIEKNAQDNQKIDILFNNSYKLTEIEKISYSIYNTNGYAKSGQADFIPKQIVLEQESYYTYTIDERLTEKGKYYIELQFLKENKVIETTTIEYVNLEA